MSFIRILIFLMWSSPLLLLASPFHVYDNIVNARYILIVLIIILIIIFQINGKQIEVRTSILSNNIVRKFHFLLVMFLLCLSIIVFVSLIIGGSGIRENREIFQNNYTLYNYVFVSTVFSSVIISLSQNSPRNYKIIASISWVFCGLLLLLTGNRQFIFFSIVYLIFYKLGISKYPGRLFIKVLFCILLILILAISFSVLRLDYILADDLGAYGKYMSILTGAKCDGALFCDNWTETIFQLLYAYLGLNYSGLTYSIDFFGLSGGASIGSITFPVIFRRIESLGFHSNLNEYIHNYDFYISTIAGGNYSHFFSTMFGDVASESGFVGVVLFSFIVFILISYYIRVINGYGREIDYMIFIFICANLVFGFLQFPFTEPFIFFAFINLFINSLIEFLGRISKKSLQNNGNGVA